jgi:hypothetical protein
VSDHLQDSLARFRAAADAAVERGRRAAADARESGAAFDRETRQLTDRIRRGELDPRPERLTPVDMRTAATEYRQAQGLPAPEVEIGPAAVQPAPDDDDEYFSEQRIMRKV